MTEPRRPEDVERLLSERERQLLAANQELEQKSREIEQLEQDVKTLAHWSKTLDSGISALLGSRRWKLGDRLTELGRKTLLRPEVRTVVDDLGVIGESFRAWREEFDARRFEQAKGRPGAIETRDPQNLTLSADETSIDSDGAALAPPAGRWRFEGAEHILEDLENLPPVTVLVPVYNAYEDLKGCLEALVRNTTAPAELLLIDDASPDARIAPLLAEYGALENIRVLRNDENLGFVRTVNRGLSACGSDVVLLNSDAEVTPRWLENLTLAAYADPRTATVTAISDNAGAFSVPAIGEKNETPEGLGRDEMGRLVTQQSGQVYPQSPTGSGFCMYVKRAALDDVGLLDAESFPRGYGEENDLCMRAFKRGWNHVVDDTTFVFHERMASFGSEKQEALKAGREALDRLHPEYTKLARVFVSSEDMERVGDNVRAAYSNVESGRAWANPRILFVLHRAGGGTHYTTQDLMGALDGRYSPYVLVSDGLRLKLFRHGAEGPILVEEWTLRRKWRITEFSRPDYRAIVFRLLVKYRFELVHVRHLMGHTFDLPEIAARLRIPVILSFHDFYLSCPTTQLIDNNGKYCGGICTPGYGKCRLPKVVTGDVPDGLKNDWIHTWRLHVERMFEYVDAFLTTSLDAKEVHLRSLPGLRGRRFEVIEHGRDLEQAHLAAPPGEGPIRILIPGNIEAHKGAEFLRELRRIDVENRLELHFLGNVVPRFQDLGVMHGPYERGEFNDRVREIAPSFIGIFSIWPETYCHTLTEAWAAGVPVLASDIGTLRERVNAHGGGWLLDHEDPRGSYQRILEIAGDRAAYDRELERADLHGIKSVGEMAGEYEGLYEAVRREHRSFESVS